MLEDFDTEKNVYLQDQEAPDDVDDANDAAAAGPSLSCRQVPRHSFFQRSLTWFIRVDVRADSKIELTLSSGASDELEGALTTLSQAVVEGVAEEIFRETRAVDDIVMNLIMATRGCLSECTDGFKGIAAVNVNVSVIDVVMEQQVRPCLDSVRCGKAVWELRGMTADGFDIVKDGLFEQLFERMHVRILGGVGREEAGGLEGVKVEVASGGGGDDGMGWERRVRLKGNRAKDGFCELAQLVDRVGSALSALVEELRACGERGSGALEEGPLEGYESMISKGCTAWVAVCERVQLFVEEVAQYWFVADAQAPVWRSSVLKIVDTLVILHASRVNFGSEDGSSLSWLQGEMMRIVAEAVEAIALKRERAHSAKAVSDIDSMAMIVQLRARILTYLHAVIICCSALESCEMVNFVEWLFVVGRVLPQDISAAVGLLGTFFLGLRGFAEWKEEEASLVTWVAGFDGLETLLPNALWPLWSEKRVRMLVELSFQALLLFTYKSLLQTHSEAVAACVRTQVRVDAARSALTEFDEQKRPLMMRTALTIVSGQQENSNVDGRHISFFVRMYSDRIDQACVVVWYVLRLLAHRTCSIEQACLIWVREGQAAEARGCEEFAVMTALLESLAQSINFLFSPTDTFVDSSGACRRLSLHHPRACQECDKIKVSFDMRVNLNTLGQIQGGFFAEPRRLLLELTKLMRTFLYNRCVSQGTVIQSSVMQRAWPGTTGSKGL
jgi:hypothetical protein